MSKIEWTEKTWNPIVGCSVVSPGCTNCYAMRMAHRLGQNSATPHYAGLTQMSRGGPVWTGKMALAPEHVLAAPVHRKKPTTWFVNSMGDLFHEDVPDEWIDKVFHLMAITPWHRYQVLTKRADRMREYLTSPVTRQVYPGLPLPNVWLGVSAEDHTRADERIPQLLETPAAVRFVSAEPLLGPISLEWLAHDGDGVIDALRGETWVEADGPATEVSLHGQLDLVVLRRSVIAKHPKVDWVIAGGESGKSARPMHPVWARMIRDQCIGAGVPYFFKQWGEYVSVSEVEGPGDHHKFPDGATVRRTGKKLAGRTLDGRVWDQMPKVVQ